ncbi:MAG TPA: hypothetical protein VFV67_05960 [Actinophytocola sp.]|uniref:hypothetical protein n=1 Tax=Actinophytocola sp. TaxID=1872138 RepID=UPI002DBDBB64|nr:hypothetical protein [Actinophytocola sp.]HEU5470179.1 hypothetical protein [Actinophytocola sp.]
MRARHVLAGLALGAAFALGGTPLAAQATESTQSAKANDTNADEPSWHYHSTYYNNPSYCTDAGEATGLPYECWMGLPGAVLPFYLYLWY